MHSLAVACVMAGASVLGVAPGAHGGSSPSTSAGAANNPVELGRVRWGRDVDAGFREARARARPLFLLFQEIPGCATCVNFGRGPLSHPLLVDAIENEFVPVAVYNNRDGADAAALTRFREPAWNNPVVRFFAPDGSELLERRDGVWDAGGIAGRMVQALQRAKRPVPGYLSLAADEVETWRAERATFAMHCFWQGEAALGGLDGVVDTRVGWLHGREVVEVHYLPERIAYETLLERAVAFDCADRVFAHSDAQLTVARKKLGDRAVRTDESARDAKISDRKWHLQRSPLRWLPLTAAQAARVNADLGAGRDGTRWLSARQRDLAQRIEAAAQRDALRGLQLPDVVFGERRTGKSRVRAAAGVLDDVERLDRYETELEARLARSASP